MATLIIREEEIKYLIDRSTESRLISQETSLKLNSINQTSILQSLDQDAKLIYTGIPGPTGATGAPGAPGGEDEVAQAKRVDFINDNLLYKGEASPGTLDSAAAWRIREITISAIDDDVTEKWANGSADYIHTWDNRLSYPYT